jgi:chromate reductase, NAD(P)H dehydrogenase (quinone)
MATIIGLCGSLRRASFNLALLKAAAAAAPPGTSIAVASIREIPLYDGDLEATDGIPKAVQDLKDQIAAADGLLIVTPEYNNSMPGVVKNAIDWLSRPGSDIPRVFRGRPVALMGATPGQGGTLLSQAAWLPVLRTLGMRPWFEGRLQISGAGKVFDGEGRVIDPATLDRIRTFVEGFAAFAEAERRPADDTLAQIRSRNSA